MVTPNEIKIKEKDIKYISISLELLDPQTYTSKRDMEKEKRSVSFLKFSQTIVEVGGIFHPIIVREDGAGKFEIFAGQRRYEVYKMLTEQGKEEFKKIPARVYPQTTTLSFMCQLMIFENDAREDYIKQEKIESKLSSIPLLLELENAKGNNFTENLILGHRILGYHRLYSTEEKMKDIRLNEIFKLTGNIDVISNLYHIFEKIGTTYNKFQKYAEAYFKLSDKLLAMFRKDIIRERHAFGIQTMKSKEDKNEIILRLKKGEDITYGELEKYIRNSNSKFSPVKKNNKLIQEFEHALIQLKGDKGIDRTEHENDEIKMYIEKIENNINKGR